MASRVGFGFVCCFFVIRLQTMLYYVVKGKELCLKFQSGESQFNSANGT